MISVAAVYSKSDVPPPGAPPGPPELPEGGSPIEELPLGGAPIELDCIEELAEVALALSDAELVPVHPVKTMTDSMAATMSAAIFLVVFIEFTSHRFKFKDSYDA